MVKHFYESYVKKKKVTKISTKKPLAVKQVKIKRIIKGILLR